MADVILHDKGREGNYPVRNYHCACGLLHQYKRPFDEIPTSPLCCGIMRRAWGVDGLRFQVTTPIREVRHKLREEERLGQRPKAIDRNMNPHIATV